MSHGFNNGILYIILKHENVQIKVEEIQMKKIVKLLGAVCFFIMMVSMPHRNVYADEAIDISTPEQFEAIGKSPEYPMDADYVLTCDIDMTGIKHTPIGTAVEPFTGTFDGAGYTIKNVNIEGNGLGNITMLENENITGYGIFGVVKNSSESQSAAIYNLNISNVTMEASSCNDSAAGVLAAVLYNGVTVKNVSIINSSIELNGAKGKILYGAGNLVGVIWTEQGSGHSLKTNITDVYTNGYIHVSGFSEENTVSGVVGCVYNASISSISCVISLGELLYDDQSGYGITTSKKYDANGIADEVIKVYYAKEDNRTDNGVGNGIAKGVLASGKVALNGQWQQAQGVLPVPNMTKDNEDISERIYPKLKRNQSIESITEDFYVSTFYNEKPVLWTSSSPNVVIDGTTGLASVTFTDGKSERAKLTYTCGEYTGDISITIGEAKDICFDKQYVKPGETLKVLYAMDNATYKWEILHKETGKVKTFENTTGEYQVTEDDLEAFIYVTINGGEKLSIYVSSLPIVYIDAKTSFGNIGKTSYYDGSIRISGDSEEYAPWDLYDGSMEFKGRGHSSSYYEKVGLKLKLSEKSDMYGMSGYENKHWVLVSNVLDSSLMRNSIMDKFYTAMGADSIMEYTDVILIYNGDYKGVYQLVEHVRIDEGRVEVFDYDEYAKEVAETIAKTMVDNRELSAHFEKSYAEELKTVMESNYAYIDNGYVDDSDGRRHEFSSYDIKRVNPTGGYLVVMDRYSQQNRSKQATLYTAYTLPLYMDKPDTDAKSQLTSLKESYLYDYAIRFNQSFEYALHSDDFFFRNEDTHYKVAGQGTNESGRWSGMTYVENSYTDDEHDGLHYSEMFDMDSLVQNFLVCEFSQNYDSMKNSFYYQKDVDELAVVAPFWDYDWSMGNWITTRYTNMPTKWQTTLDGAAELFYQHVSWNRMLIRDPYFLMKVWEKYADVRDDIEEIVKEEGFVDTQYDKLKKAASANDVKWAHLEIFTGFEPSMKDLRNFLGKRVEWLDKQFESLDKLVESLGYYHASDYLKVESVTRNQDGSAHIEASVSNTSVVNIAFQINGTYLVTVSVENGKASLDVPVEELVTGSNNLVEVKAMDSNGNYLINSKYSDTGNYNLVHSNYYMFE